MFYPIEVYPPPPVVLMLKPASMKRFYIIAPEKYEDPILEAIVESGIAHLIKDYVVISKERAEKIKACRTYNKTLDRCQLILRELAPQAKIEPSKARELIRAVLERQNGNVSKTARILGISRQTVRRARDGSLEDKSRRPHRIPRKTDTFLEKLRISLFLYYVSSFL